MDISINSHFHPFRMVLRNKEPVQLAVELINRSNENKMLSVQVSLARPLSLDKSGLVSGRVEKIHSLKPGEKRKFYYDIFPKTTIMEGEYAVQLKVLEHYRDYKYVQREFTKNLSLKVQ